MGRETRKRIPRTIHATLELPADRDPIAILTEQERDRLADLVPIRHSRMAESAFAYYRGAPAVMAADLATGAQTGIIVQASGDAHISNFGLFASPERTLVFDANDFDETLAGPVGVGRQAPRRQASSSPAGPTGSRPPRPGGRR